jgi:hypothetical protein
MFLCLFRLGYPLLQWDFPTFCQKEPENWWKSLIDLHLWLLGAAKGEEEGVADTVGTFDGWVLGFLVGASEGEF